MKKKFIAVYALMGVLALGSTTLTSCVDDNESASVTAIRTAKAEQLKAYASYYTAQANYQNAYANYQQALADAKNQETDEAKAEWAYELESLKKKYEQEIANYEKDIALAKQALAGTLDAYRGQLFTNYEDAVGEVNTINQSITKNLYLIAQLKNEVISLNAANALLNYQDSIVIAENKAKIEIYEQMSGSSLEDLKAEDGKLAAQIEEQNQKDAVADRKLSDATNAFKQEIVALVGSANQEPTSPTVLAARDSLTKRGYFVSLHLEKTNENLPAEYLTTSTEWVEGAEDLGLTDASIIKYSTLIPSAVTTAENLLAAEVYEAEKALGKADDAATGTTAYAIYNRYGEAVKTAQTAYDNALKGTDTEAIEAARQALETAKANQQLYQENGLQNAIDAVEEAKEMQTAFANVQKAFEGDTYKAYETAISTALTGENAKAMVAAQEEINDIAVVNAQLTASQSAVSTLIATLEGTNSKPEDVRGLILSCEDEIAKKEKDIANRTAINKTVTDKTNPAYGLAVDDAIAMIEAQNEQLKEKLEAAEAYAETTKAELDAAFAEAPATDTPATDTPAEGEETPAA